MCEHKNSQNRGSWLYCLDCGAILGDSTCEHEDFALEAAWMICQDCGAARHRAEKSWIFPNEL